jgi:hypothetical protein
LMALLAEGETYPVAFYKYGPPDGGRTEPVRLKSHF